MLQNSRVATLVGVSLLTLLSTASAQWLTQPTAGIPRLPDGKPNLSAATPRSADGKPDLSGLWHAGPKWESDVKDADVQPWAREQSQQRTAILRRSDGVCCAGRPDRWSPSADRWR